ncbi:MAG TPA: SMP-30/gluconolactonase/LRE family protein, partial [Vicinamibacteria bacterium]
MTRNRRASGLAAKITLAAASLATSTARAEGPAPGVKIVRASAALDTLLARDAVVEKLADGYQWTEGPLWDKTNARLLFSDIPGNRIIAWAAGKGAAEWLKPSGYTGSAPFTGREPGSNGLAFDAKGDLILCQHGDRRLARRGGDGKFTTLADRYEGKRLNSPNDLNIRPNGDILFTDPPYGLPGTFTDPARELPFTGVYRRGTDGKVTLLVKDMTAPNGIGVSPDGKTLYVANSDPKRAIWMVFPLREDGTVGEGRVFFDSTSWVGKERPGLPDGLKVDVAGNVFATGPGGVIIFNAKGEHLGTIETGVPTANCAFGDDGRTLYITANTGLL